MVRIDDIALYYLSIATEQTLSFGDAHVDHITVVRLGMTAHRTDDPTAATGWADVPLNLAWAWPGHPIVESERISRRIIEDIRSALLNSRVPEDPFSWHLEILQPVLERAVADNRTPRGISIPDLVTSLLSAPFDIAWHDLFGLLNDRPSWSIYRQPWVKTDLARLCPDETGCRALLGNLYPADILNPRPRSSMTAWHLVGMTDPVGMKADPRDLSHWIARDGLHALKIKLNGSEPSAAVERLASVVDVARTTQVRLLSLDFNGTLPGPDAYEEFARGLIERIPDLQDGSVKLAMVEQPFATGSIPAAPEGLGRLQPIFSLDESISDPAAVFEAHAAGWDGIVVKTCKTQTRAILLAAVARRLGMRVIVQDLTNPMLALLAHLQLAAYLDDGWGVEVNGIQYYPTASVPEAQIHPAAFQRRDGLVSTASLKGPGLGYRISEIERQLPERAA